MTEMGSNIRVGLIGAGRIGRLHGDHLRRHLSGANLAAIVDAQGAVAEDLGKSLGVERTGSNPDLIFEDPSIHAVLICSSTDTHAEFIEAAAKAGKHIFCEKPIARSLDAIDRALAEVSRAGVKIQIGFNRRFDPNFAHIRESVSFGAVGVPHLLKITSRDPSPPSLDYIKVSGGIFLDMTIHDFDMARFLMGSEVLEVHAMGSSLVDREIERLGDVDTAVITMKFKNGAIGVIDNSRKAVYGYDQRVEVFGSEGMLSADNNTDHRTWHANSSGIHHPRPKDFFMDRYIVSYLEEIRAFVESVGEDRPTPVNGADGRIPVVMALAAKRSLDENRPVRLSEIDSKRVEF